MDNTPPQDPDAPEAFGVLPFEAVRYLAHVEELDMTESQKIIFLRTLWDIMATFVRMGFDVESVVPGIFNNASENARDALQEIFAAHEFNVAADQNNNEKDRP